MLVLSAKPGEEIIINENVVVTVMEFRDNVVRLGFTCDKSIPVDRRKVHESKMRDRAAAGTTETRGS